MKANLNFNDAGTYSDNGEGTYFPEVSLGIAGRIGLDGASAYEIAVKHGYEGTETEWAASLVNPADEGAKRAEKAAEKAQETADGISTDLTGKASLDDNKKYVIPSQIGPLTGLQSGAVCKNGHYSTTGGVFTDYGTKSVELLFTTPEELSGTAYLINTTMVTKNINVFLDGDKLNINAITSYLKYTVTPGTTYHVVMVYKKDGKSQIFVNGTQIGSGNGISEIAVTFILGNNAAGNAPFKGIIHRLRFFDDALSTEDAEWLWNNGRPGKIGILHQWHQKLTRTCIAEYTGHGLLTSEWRDTSGVNTNLKAVGSPEYSYILPQDMNELVVSSGIVTKDIMYGGTGSLAIPVPKGYVPYSMVVRNYNPNDITDFHVMTYDELNIVVPKSKIRQGAWEDRLIWNGGTYRIATEDRLTAYGTGNKSGKGIEVVTTFKWIGHNHFNTK